MTLKRGDLCMIVAPMPSPVAGPSSRWSVLAMGVCSLIGLVLMARDQDHLIWPAAIVFLWIVVNGAMALVQLAARSS